MPKPSVTRKPVRPGVMLPLTLKRAVYSQNFLRPGAAVKRLVADARIRGGDLVVEIGGGAGVLTRALHASFCRLVVVERDARYSRELAHQFAGDPRVTVVEGDIRCYRWPSERFRIFANIPFGITTDILHASLDDVSTGLVRADMIVELAVARKRSGRTAGNKLNLLWAPWWTMRQGPRLRAVMFTPRPRTDAAMLVIQRRRPPLLLSSERELWSSILERGFRHGDQSLQRAFRGILTGRQVQLLAAHNGLSMATPVSLLTLDHWLAIHAVVRDYASAEHRSKANALTRPRWPAGFCQWRHDVGVMG